MKDGTEYIDDIIKIIIEEIADLWFLSKYNPQRNEELINSWKNIINDWAYDETMPLIIRKPSIGRGKVIIHNSNRKVLISDNSPAQWVYWNILNNKIEKINNIKNMIHNEEFPLKYIEGKSEEDDQILKGKLGKYSINSIGWKLCHIEKVGLNSKNDIKEIKIEVLIEKFILLMNPGNMFLLPKIIGGIGEVDYFINIIKEKYPTTAST